MASRSFLLLCLIVASTPVLAQTRPTPPPGRPPARAPTPAPAQRTITPAQGETATEGTRTKPTCEQVKRNARYGIYFDKVEIEKLVQTVADATCRTFILPENVRGKISIVGPENGRVEVTGDQFYAAFLAALDANGLAVYQHGKFMKVVDKRSAKQSPIPTVFGSEADYTFNEQMVTRLFRIKNVEIEPLRGVLSQLVSKEGDCIPYAPDTLICNDVGSNLHRLERIIDQLDTKATTDEVEIVQVQYAAATDVAATIQKIFETKAARPGTRPGAGTVRNPRNPARNQPAAPATTTAASNLEESGGGPVTLSQIIPDERTNKLIIVASPAAFERITQLIREIDIPISGEGRINVHYLENASAEDIASTLQSLAQGTGASSNRPARPPTPQGQQPGAQGATTAELFAGEVKISADKATNSLVIIASQSDYRNLVRVIEKLDIPRRQVFVEAVIMEVNLDRNSEFGLSFHQGIPLNTEDGVIPALIGTNYGGSGLPPSFSLESLASFGGFLAGLQGPVIPALSKLGVNIPAFGVVLHALQQSSDVNVLSTPHLLTSDNEEAEITVGQNVPFQAGFNPTGVSSLLGANAGASSLLTGGLSSLYAPINRQNVELKLTIKPQIAGGDSDLIRLVISEQTEEIASQDPVLGPTTSKRSAKTTVVARNQETVVIGGIMQDRTIESTAKVPILGDIPLLGHLFRDTTRRKVKTNLLLFLTPYIINDQGDFRAIFERKMEERQQFVEQFYGQVPGYDMAVDFSRKAGPLARIHRTALREEEKLENGGPGAAGEQLISPGASPGTVRSSKRGEGESAAEPVPGGEAPPLEAPASPAAPPPEAATPPVDDKQQLEVRPPPIDEYDQQ